MYHKIYFVVRFTIVVIFSLLGSGAISAQTDTLKKENTSIYYVHLTREIMPAAGRLIAKAVDEAEAMKADMLILNINTYGGRLDIADSIRSRLLYATPKTVAFINNNAASAGALISLACDKIYMVPGASMGAATVVNETGEQMPDKYQSYMRGMMRSTAETKGRDPLMAEAMVDDRISIPGVIDSGKVLTLTAVEAVQYKMADGIANDVKEVIKELGIEKYTIKEHKESNLDKLINFLLNPMVNSILLLVIIGGIYFELKTPGVGFPLLAALTAAILYFAPLMLDGSAVFWELLLFLVGVALLLVEIFLIPGFGVAGISGIILIIAGLTFSLVGFQGFDINPVGLDLLGLAFFRVMLTFVIGIVLIMAFGGAAFSLPGLNKAVLSEAQTVDKGYSIKRNDLYQLIGKEGKVIGTLRPSGKVLIDGEIFDAVTESSFIEPDTMVSVKGVEGYSLVVRKKLA